MRGKVLATASFGSGGALDKCRNTVSCRPPDVAKVGIIFLYFFLYSIQSVHGVLSCGYSWMIDNPFYFFSSNYLGRWRLGPLYNKNDSTHVI